MNQDSLDKLKPGECCVIREYCNCTSDTNCLMEMGLLEGTPVKLIKFAPLGDPMEIRFRGYNLSIRKDVARSILVEKG
ncbi:MAG: ferrous iron transport protein A [Calditrichaeota bacterium]|nr:ferrous iron transport protein A [Calditrichota bacterium]MCB0268888.1 ferrous iron transport protein A [Calditrichota bacterium]MCB0285979.1 ferrous iron transport protein A [Calditrichota bacterium]MCB0299727.1 ferrous iron transport protein A [Calditrichota bacterium]MCB9070732.1 ferrous iron transport protein A [Calditrichia bacterium]